MRKLRHSWRLFGRLFYPGVAAECILGRLIHPDMHVAFTWIFLFSCVRLFMTPWTEACQASLSFTISQSLLTLMSIESVMPSNHLILCRLLLLPSIFPSFRVFSNSSYKEANLLELQLQYQSFQ